MALQHAQLHPDMEQQQYTEGLVRFLEAHPPNEALLADLRQALQSAPEKKAKQQQQQQKKKKKKSKPAG